MRAAVYVEDGKPLELEDLDLLEPGRRDVVVHMGASGICHSDLSISEGRMGIRPPLILGHEGSGMVEAVGSAVRSLEVGDRVVATAIPACMECWPCVRGQSYLCESQRIRPTSRAARAGGDTLPALGGLGTFAEFMTTRESHLVKVETDLPDEQLALIGCGFTTGFGAALNTAAVQPGSTVAVVGCGGVGQAVIQGARIAGAALIVAVDPGALKRTTALRVGASHTIDPAAGDPVAQVRDLTAGRGVDYAFETAGSPATIEQAFAMARRGGTAVVVGASPLDEQVSLSAFGLMNDGKRLIGSVLGSSLVRRDFPRTVALAEAGKLDLGALVTRSISLEDVNDGLQAIGAGEVIRTVIAFGR